MKTKLVLVLALLLGGCASVHIVRPTNPADYTTATSIEVINPQPAMTIHKTLHHVRPVLPTLLESHERALRGRLGFIGLLVLAHVESVRCA